jgi:hypothetical protein
LSKPPKLPAGVTREMVDKTFEDAIIASVTDEIGRRFNATLKRYDDELRDHMNRVHGARWREEFKKR